MNKRKKNLFHKVLSLLLIGVLFISSGYAYLLAEDNKQTVFTLGSGVKIELKEDDWFNEDNSLKEDINNNGINDFAEFINPNTPIKKAPYIQNLCACDVWVYIMVGTPLATSDELNSNEINSIYNKSNILDITAFAVNKGWTKQEDETYLSSWEYINSKLSVIEENEKDFSENEFNEYAYVNTLTSLNKEEASKFNTDDWEKIEFYNNYEDYYYEVYAYKNVLKENETTSPLFNYIYIPQNLTNAQGNVYKDKITGINFFNSSYRECLYKPTRPTLLIEYIDENLILNTTQNSSLFIENHDIAILPSAELTKLNLTGDDKLDFDDIENYKYFTGYIYCPTEHLTVNEVKAQLKIINTENSNASITITPYHKWNDDWDVNTVTTGTIIQLYQDADVVETYCVIQKGDINCDGSINSTDKNLLSELDYDKAPDFIKRAADLNNDGKFTQEDINMCNNSEYEYSSQYNQYISSTKKAKLNIFVNIINKSGNKISKTRVITKYINENITLDKDYIEGTAFDYITEDYYVFDNFNDNGYTNDYSITSQIGNTYEYNINAQENKAALILCYYNEQGKSRFNFGSNNNSLTYSTNPGFALSTDSLSTYKKNKNRIFVTGNLEYTGQRSSLRTSIFDKPNIYYDIYKTTNSSGIYTYSFNYTLNGILQQYQYTERTFSVKLNQRITNSLFTEVYSHTNRQSCTPAGIIEYWNLPSLITVR